MSVDRKEIDLIIRAALQGGKTLDGVTKSIREIEQAIEAQSDAAKRGEDSIDELKSSLAALKQVQDQLKGQADLIGQFERLSKQIETSSKRVTDSAKAHADYKDKLDKAGKATDFQANKLVKLANASERNQQTLARQRADQEALAASLNQAGVSVDQLTAAETKARQSAAQLGVAINRVQGEISNYASTVRDARVEQQRMADDELFDRKLAEAAKLNKAGEYVRFWEDALRKADQTEQQLKVSAALRKTADEAIAAARGYRTLGTAAKSISGSQDSLRSIITGILDPAQQARVTLEGVENQIREVAAAASVAKGPVDDYSNKIQTLNKAVGAISTQSALVDQFTRQVATLRQARTEYSQARAQVLQFAQALKSSTGENQQLQNSLRQSQATLAAAQRNLSNQVQTTRQLRDSMRQAGLATNDLAGTQARLVSAAQSATTATRNLADAKKRYGESVRDAANAEDLFTSSGRTTLSYVQRLRGEVLSLVAAYGGIYGVIDLARKSIDAFSTRQGLMNQLALSVGDDSSAIASEYAYIAEQADRIGLSFETAAKGYAKFSASARLAGQDQQTIRYIFESFSEVGRVAELSADNMDGVFKALEQIMSKGTIQAEELRGQLGDRLFGAFQVAAQALKDQFPELDKAMKNGLVTSEQLVLIAEKYKEIVGTRLPQATQALTANQARLNTALFNFRLQVADSGFADSYIKLLERLTGFLQSSDGEKFARDIGDALSNVADGLRWIVENADLVKKLLVIGVLFTGAKMAGSFAIALATLPARLMAVGTAAKGASVMVGLLNKAFLGLNALGLGVLIGTLLNEFDVVKKWGVSFVRVFEEVRIHTTYAIKALVQNIDKLLVDGLSATFNWLTGWARDFMGLFAKVARSAGNNSAADAIEDMIKQMKLKTGRARAAAAGLRREMNAELKLMRETTQQMFNEIGNPAATVRAGAAAGATPRPNLDLGGKGGKGDGAAKAELDRRVKLKEDIEAALNEVETRIVRNEKDSLESRLQVIYAGYAKLRDKIAALGGPEAQALSGRLSNLIGELQIQEIEKFNAELESQRLQSLNKLESMESSAGRKQRTELQSRLEAISLQYADHYRDLDKLREQYVSNGRDTADIDAMQVRMDAALEGLKALETQKYYEDAINAVLAERKAKLDAINAQQQAGLLTQYEANRQASGVIDEMQPKLEGIVNQGLAYADAMIAAAQATGQNVTNLETLRAKLFEAQTSGRGLNRETQITNQLTESLANGATTAFMRFGEGMAAFAMGQRTAKEALLDLRNAFLQFAADFMLEIAKMIAKEQLLAMFKGMSGSGGWVGALASMVVGTKHTGGVVGSGGRSRRVDPSVFLGAPRYHGGGVPGLAQGEYATILKKNEEVLTESDPRHVFNGGSQGGGGQSAQDVSIYNYVDPKEMLSAALGTAAGRKIIMNTLGAERSQLRSLVGVKG